MDLEVSGHSTVGQLFFQVNPVDVLYAVWVGDGTWACQACFSSWYGTYDEGQAVLLIDEN